jgi:drug/metabolite transporter (DMT)-like permease
MWNTAYKYAVDGLPVMTVLPVMLLTAAAALWGCALARGRQRLTRRQLRRIAVMGMIDPAIGYALIGVGLTHVEATVSAMLDGTEACFVVAFAAIIARRSPGPRAVIGVLLSAAGVAVLGGTHSLLGFGPWNLVVLGGVACAGLCNVLTDRVLGDDVDPLTVTAHQMGFAALCTLPLLGWQWQAGAIGGPAVRPADWAVAMASGIALAAGFLLYNYAIIRVPVTTAGMILNTLPVFGVAAAIAFLGERITWAQVVGALVILIAFFLFEEGGDQAEDTQVPGAQHSPAPAISSPELVTGGRPRLGARACYILNLTAVNMECGALTGQVYRGPAHGMRDRRCGRMSELAIGPSLSFPFLGVDAAGVRLERLLARVKGLLGRRPAVRAEDVALGHLREPVPQLDQVDLVLLKLRVGEVVLVVFLLHLAKEVRALVDDFLVLVVAGRLERVAHLGLAGQHGARQQHRRTGHVEDFPAQLAQRPLRGGARGQRGDRILQVDSAQALDAAPDRGPQPGRFRRDPVDQQQPAPGFLAASVRLVTSISHSRILPES